MTRPPARQRRLSVDDQNDGLGPGAWRERYEQVLAANERLHARLGALEAAHRRARTVVKYEPALPNNDVYTKELLEENHALLRGLRALELRLVKLDRARGREAEPPTSTRSRRPRRWLPVKHASVQTDEPKSRIIAAETENKETDNENDEATPLKRATTLVPEDNQIDRREAEAVPKFATPARSSVVPELVAQLQQRLEQLGVDVERLRQENELLRREAEVENRGDQQNATEPEVDRGTQKPYADLEFALEQRIRQLTILEAQFTHLQEKSRAKSVLFQQSAERIDELNGRLFDANERLRSQEERLAAKEEQCAKLVVAEKEIRLLRSENMKLNEAVSVLTSRPFEALDAKLLQKNVTIATLEDANKRLEVELTKASQDYRIISQTNDSLRERVTKLTGEVDSRASELAKLEQKCNLLQMEHDISTMKLDFMLTGDLDNQQFMEAVGLALKSLKSGAKVETTPNGAHLNRSSQCECHAAKPTALSTPQKEHLGQVTELTALLKEEAKAQLDNQHIAHRVEIRKLHREIQRWKNMASEHREELQNLRTQQSNFLSSRRISTTHEMMQVSAPDNKAPIVAVGAKSSIGLQNTLELSLLQVQLDSARMSALEVCTTKSPPRFVLMCDFFDFESQVSPIFSCLPEEATDLDFSITFNVVINKAFVKSPFANHITIELYLLTLNAPAKIGQTLIPLQSLFVCPTGSVSLQAKLHHPSNTFPVAHVKIAIAFQRPVDHLVSRWISEVDPMRHSTLIARVAAASPVQPRPSRLVGVRIISLLLMRRFLSALPETFALDGRLAIHYRFMGHPRVICPLYIRGPLSGSCILLPIDSIKLYEVDDDNAFTKFLSQYELPITISENAHHPTSSKPSCQSTVQFKQAINKLREGDSSTILTGLTVTERSSDRIAGRLCVELVFEGSWEGCAEQRSIDLTEIRRGLMAISGVLSPKDHFDWTRCCDVLGLSALERSLRQLLRVRSQPLASLTSSHESKPAETYGASTGDPVQAIRHELTHASIEVSRIDFEILHLGLVQMCQAENQSQQHLCRNVVSRLQLLLSTCDSEWLRVEGFLRRRVEVHKLRAANGTKSRDTNRSEVVDWETLRNRLRLE